MAVRIRLSRYGRLHRPIFRIIAIDKRRHREGEANEILGSYDPQAADQNVQVDIDGVQRWIAQGAQITEQVSTLLKRYGYKLPAKPVNDIALAAARVARKEEKVKATLPKKGEKQPWVAPSRRALRGHAAKLKAERKIATAAQVAEAAAKKAAEAPAEAAKT